MNCLVSNFSNTQINNICGISIIYSQIIEELKKFNINLKILNTQDLNNYIINLSKKIII